MGGPYCWVKKGRWACAKLATERRTVDGRVELMCPEHARAFDRKEKK